MVMMHMAEEEVSTVQEITKDIRVIVTMMSATVSKPNLQSSIGNVADQVRNTTLIPILTNVEEKKQANVVDHVALEGEKIPGEGVQKGISQSHTVNPIMDQITALHTRDHKVELVTEVVYVGEAVVIMTEMVDQGVQKRNLLGIALDQQDTGHLLEGGILSVQEQKIVMVKCLLMSC